MNACPHCGSPIYAPTTTRDDLVPVVIRTCTCREELSAFWRAQQRAATTPAAPSEPPVPPVPQVRITADGYAVDSETGIKVTPSTAKRVFQMIGQRYHLDANGQPQALFDDA